MLTSGTEEVGAVHNSLLYIAMHTNHLSGGAQGKSINCHAGPSLSGAGFSKLCSVICTSNLELTDA